MLTCRKDGMWGLGIVPKQSVFPYPPEFTLRSPDQLISRAVCKQTLYPFLIMWNHVVPQLVRWLARSKDSETSGRGRRSHRKRSSILPFSFKKPSVSREDNRFCIPLYIKFSRKPRCRAPFIKSGEESGTSRQQRPHRCSP